ncbi:unnamed protein product [Diamesa tonsa]
MSSENKYANNGIFKWTDKEKELLIDEYEKDMENIMNKYKSQKIIWNTIAKRMKESSIFSERKKQLLNAGVCQRRWTLLRDNFKAQYFNNTITEDQKEKITPKLFYRKLQNLYHNYVTNKVNETKASEEFGNMTIDLERSIKCLLNNQDAFKVLSNNNNDVTTEGEKPSQSQMLLRQIKALPKDEVYIERFKTRIDPNTPFNKNYSYQTKQQSQKTYTRTKLSMDDEEARSEINKLKDITILYPSCNENNLDTCDLSSINHGDVSSCYIDNQTKSLNVPIDLEISTDPGPSRSKYSDYQYLDNTTIEAVDDYSSNIIDKTVENPAKKVKIEKPSLQMTSASSSSYCDQQVKKEVPLNTHSKFLVVRKVVAKLPTTPQPESITPNWTVKFMMKYEADMRRLNNKVDQILYQIAQNARAAPKREADEDDIY